MEAVLKERRITEEEQEMLELEESHPEKFDPDFTFKVNQEHSDRKSKTNAYETIPRHVVEQLMAEHWAHIERDKERRALKEQQEKEWALPKTTESAPKTKSKTKPTNSTKA